MSSTSFKTVAITILVGIAILVCADLVTGWIAAMRLNRSANSGGTA